MPFGEISHRGQERSGGRNEWKTRGEVVSESRYMAVSLMLDSGRRDVWIVSPRGLVGKLHAVRTQDWELETIM